MPTGDSHRPACTAVIGGGVSGLTAAYLLSRRDEVTLFEREPRLGGHAHTHTLETPAGRVDVDSGFIVLNDRTYPLLRQLFAELGVQTRPTEMSMSIRDERTGIEYAGGRGLGGFLARPRQLLVGDYTRTLREVRRFHAAASEMLATTSEDDLTSLGDVLDRHQFGPAFVRLYAVPVVACVWSSGAGDALDYPARYLFRFLEHHGMLSVGGSPQWATVVGGSRRYVDALAARLQHVRRAEEVTAVTRDGAGVEVHTSAGAQRFDRVVVATHADEALTLLADATPREKEVLGAFRYSANETVLHSDPGLMPRARLARASWNYLTPSEAGRPTVVTYSMNRLQGIAPSTPLYVTLNATERLDPAKVIATMTYRHPVYDAASVAAQQLLPSLTTERIAFAGAHHGWGFHEDGCRSGVEAARAFGVEWP